MIYRLINKSSEKPTAGYISNESINAAWLSEPHQYIASSMQIAAQKLYDTMTFMLNTSGFKSVVRRKVLLVNL